MRTEHAIKQMKYRLAPIWFEQRTHTHTNTRADKLPHLCKKKLQTIKRNFIVHREKMEWCCVWHEWITFSILTFPSRASYCRKEYFFWADRLEQEWMKFHTNQFLWKQSNSCSNQVSNTTGNWTCFGTTLTHTLNAKRNLGVTPHGELQMLARVCVCACPFYCCFCINLHLN